MGIMYGYMNQDVVKLVYVGYMNRDVVKLVYVGTHERLSTYQSMMLLPSVSIDQYFGLYNVLYRSILYSRQCQNHQCISVM